MWKKLIDFLRRERIEEEIIPIPQTFRGYQLDLPFNGE